MSNKNDEMVSPRCAVSNELVLVTCSRSRTVQRSQTIPKVKGPLFSNAMNILENRVTIPQPSQRIPLIFYHPIDYLLFFFIDIDILKVAAGRYEALRNCTQVCVCLCVCVCVCLCTFHPMLWRASDVSDDVNVPLVPSGLLMPKNP